MDKFVAELAAEVSKRLRAANVKGRTITVKRKQRKPNAPEPGKHLGHGSCDDYSSSVTLAVATNCPHIIARTVRTCCHKHNIPPEELRGVGIQVYHPETSRECTMTRMPTLICSSHLTSMNALLKLDQHESSFNYCTSNSQQVSKLQPVTSVPGKNDAQSRRRRSSGSLLAFLAPKNATSGHSTRAPVQSTRTSVQRTRAPVQSPRSSLQSTTASVQNPRASVQSTRASVQSTRASVQSPRASVQSTTASDQSPSASVQSPKTSVQSTIASVQTTTDFVQNTTASVQSPTASVQSPRASVQSTRASVHERISQRR